MNNKSLRELVYDYFRNQMLCGKLSQGTFINQHEICSELGISKAPLRDALIQLEIEGFVEIFPRRGVRIKTLTRADVKEAFEVLATIESSAILLAFDKIGPDLIARMYECNEEQLKALQEKRSFDYYQLNLEFHDIILNASGNKLFKSIVTPIKQRLYDFPRRDYVFEWEMSNLKEHERIVVSIEKGNREAAASIMKNEHWSYGFYKDNLKKFYRH